VTNFSISSGTAHCQKLSFSLTRHPPRSFPSNTSVYLLINRSLTRSTLVILTDFPFYLPIRGARDQHLGAQPAEIVVPYCQKAGDISETCKSDIVKQVHWIGANTDVCCADNDRSSRTIRFPGWRSSHSSLAFPRVVCAKDRGQHHSTSGHCRTNPGRVTRPTKFVLNLCRYPRG